MFGLTTSMRTDSSHVARRALRAAAAIAGLAVVTFCAPGELHAQRFQQLHGSTCYDFGTSGVPVSTGGYISVGPYTPPTGGFCGTSGVDVYVVRLRANGSLAWSRTYNIGYNDETQDVKECANGDFIIVGSTDATTGCIGGRNIFALRIDSTGNVLWTRLYGTSDGDEDAFEVVETTRRPGRTSIGDFVIAGSQRNASDNTGDAYIIKITSSGTLLWGTSYNISTNDHLYAVDESRVGTSAGDIIAAGVTTVPGPLPGQQTEKGILMRVSGADGSIGAAPQGVATYGGNVATTTRFLSVEELTMGTEAGRIVAAGHSTVVGVGADHYIVKTAANPCGTLADVRFGKDSASAEEAWCVREIRSSVGGGLNNGNLIVSGHGGVPIPGGTVSVRAVLFELSPSLTLVTPPVGVGYRY